MYFANPGKAAEVLATCREATRVRLALGLPAGRILRLVELLPEGFTPEQLLSRAEAADKID